MIFAGSQAVGSKVGHEPALPHHRGHPRDLQGAQGPPGSRPHRKPDQECGKECSDRPPQPPNP